MASGNPARRTGNVISTFLPDEATTLDVVAFDNLVHARGVKLIHYRAIKCPVGLQDEHDIHRTHPDHSGCSNGFVYKAIGRVTTIFTSNATDPRKVDEGFYDGSTVAVTFPRFYDGEDGENGSQCNRVMVRPFDKFYLDEDDILVSIWDLTHRRNDELPDRVEFPIKHVAHLIDANGSWWYEGKDFNVVDGNLVWIAGRGPVPGTVYTAWYTYKPYWVCDRLVHEIRVTPVVDPIDTNLVAMERMAFGAILQREYIFRNQQADDLAPSNRGRQQRAPDSPEPQEYY